jgi:hypothetical protein
MEEILGRPRQEWSGNELRVIYDMMANCRSRRGRSIQHEQTWLNLAGFCLRPGFGDAQDSFRVEELWQVFHDGIYHGDEPRVTTQWWIMWRRVAGGLVKEAQTRLFNKVFPSIRKGETLSPEVHLLIGSLERLDMDLKARYCQIIVEQIARGVREGLQQKIWALGRISSRVPLYSGPECVVRPRLAEKWITSLLEIPWERLSRQALAVFMSQATRRIGDRELDIADSIRRRVVARLEEEGIDDGLIEVVRTTVEMDHLGRNQLFGEQLPSGLVLGP